MDELKTICSNLLKHGTDVFLTFRNIKKRMTFIDNKIETKEINTLLVKEGTSSYNEAEYNLSKYTAEQTMMKSSENLFNDNSKIRFDSDHTENASVVSEDEFQDFDYDSNIPYNLIKKCGSSATTVPIINAYDFIENDDFFQRSISTFKPTNTLEQLTETINTKTVFDEEIDADQINTKVFHDMQCPNTLELANKKYDTSTTGSLKNFEDIEVSSDLDSTLTNSQTISLIKVPVEYTPEISDFEIDYIDNNDNTKGPNSNTYAQECGLNLKSLKHDKFSQDNNNNGFFTVFEAGNGSTNINMNTILISSSDESDYQPLIYLKKQKQNTKKRNKAMLQKRNAIKNSIGNEIVTIDIYDSDDNSKTITKIDAKALKYNDTDSEGYHSSDFEFITEREAEKDGIIINFDNDTTKKYTDTLKNVSKVINFNDTIDKSADNFGNTLDIQKLSHKHSENILQSNTFNSLNIRRSMRSKSLEHAPSSPINLKRTMSATYFYNAQNKFKLENSRQDTLSHKPLENILEYNTFNSLNIKRSMRSKSLEYPPSSSRNLNRSMSTTYLYNAQNKLKLENSRQDVLPYHIPKKDFKRDNIWDQNGQDLVSNEFGYFKNENMVENNPVRYENEENFLELLADESLEDHVIPEGDDFLELFQGGYQPMEVDYMENKSIMPLNMNIEFEGIGFDMRLMYVLQDNIANEFKQEAKETTKRILEMYQEENVDPRI